jgi:hypothetical protein
MLTVVMPSVVAPAAAVSKDDDEKFFNVGSR